ncbi:MAG: folate family ECF transporter S component [Lachnospiraceae bacterium]|nr:folate family ECF transporter S component [Lachnospiraceae bacterium]
MKKKKTTSLRRRDKLTKQLCVNAVIIALFFVLDFLAIRIGNNMKITFSGLPIIVSAIFYGPVAGMAVGFIGALLGQMATYGIGLTTIFWILPAAVRGLVVGLFAVCLKKKGIMYDVKFTNIFKAPKTTKRGLYRWFYDSVVWKAKIYPMLTMTVLVSSLIVTALNTIFLYPASKIDGYYHEGLITATLVWRIINSIITAFIYVIIIPKLLSGLNKALKK